MSTSKHTRRLGQSGLEVGPIAYGLWRFVGNDVKAARPRIEAALDAGMTLIDAAAVYGLDWGGSAFGESETLLGKVLGSNVVNVFPNQHLFSIKQFHIRAIN